MFISFLHGKGYPYVHVHNIKDLLCLEYMPGKNIYLVFALAIFVYMIIILLHVLWSKVILLQVKE